MYKCPMCGHSESTAYEAYLNKKILENTDILATSLRENQELTATELAIKYHTEFNETISTVKLSRYLRKLGIRSHMVRRGATTKRIYSFPVEQRF